MRRVSLFVPCLVDQWFPAIGEATVSVLEKVGCAVDYRGDQTCCGQPAYNAGFSGEARTIARRFLKIFAGAETIVTPSGSCASMVRSFYPQLFAGMEEALLVAQLGARTFELSEFL